jgi:hypothetical protein
MYCALGNHEVARLGETVRQQQGFPRFPQQLHICVHSHDGYGLLWRCISQSMQYLRKWLHCPALIPHGMLDTLEACPGMLDSLNFMRMAEEMEICLFLHLKYITYCLDVGEVLLRRVCTGVDNAMQQVHSNRLLPFW